MDPRHDKTATSTASTAGPHVHDIEINEVGAESFQGLNGLDMDSRSPSRSQHLKKELLLKQPLSPYLR